MTQVYRISNGHDFGEIFDSVDALQKFARGHGPGRYDVDEHSLDPFHGTNVSARSRGKMIHHGDGALLADPIPW
jgi:hypothetical protein